MKSVAVVVLAVVGYWLVVLFDLQKAVYKPLVKMGIDLFEENKLPDVVTRFGMRLMLQAKLDELLLLQAPKLEQRNLRDSHGDSLRAYKSAFVADLKNRGIAEFTKDANEQHYEVDTRFYNLVLGTRHKYSSALYPDNTPVEKALDLLDEAEVRMLELYAERAQITNNCAAGANLRLMDLGCGWGSVSLWFAERFPQCLQVVGLSNSATQREYIMATAKARGLTNVNVITADITTYQLAPEIEKFDRVISIEMFEHMKNYKKLLNKVSSFLKPDGLLFVHIFVHKTTPYHFVNHGDADDWMSKYFFTGGTMPSDDLLLYFQDNFAIQNHWMVNGVHYSLTLEAWLQKMDKNMQKVAPVLADAYGADNVVLWTARWRAFFMACSETFKWGRGDEWYVAHYLFQNRP